jgi:hypothetical protein
MPGRGAFRVFTSRVFTRLGPSADAGGGSGLIEGLVEP